MSIPFPPAPWVPTATDSVTKRLPDPTMAAIAESMEVAQLLEPLELGVSAVQAELESRLSASALDVTYVSVRNSDGTPVTGPKFVVLTLSPDGTDVDDIAVYNSLDEVGD